MKKLIVSLFSIAVLIGGAAGVASAESDGKTDLNLDALKTEYETWLKEEVSSSQDIELLESLEAYEQLSEEEQLKYIDYMYNPEAQEAVMDAFTNIVEVDNSQTLTETLDDYEGIEISTEVVTPSVNKDDISIMASRTSTYKRYVTVFGIKIFQSTSVVDYTHNGKKVTGVGAGDHYVSRNLNPTLNISWSGKRQTYSSTRAQSRVNMQWNFVHKNLGITYGGGELGVWGNHKNQAGGWFNAH
ncbi:hypothetical protein [Shouchella clausii]|jgi:uncharacterized protein YxeA|uniref:Uncharacterized protein n=2 Tax=Shouchella clausii TaxID=79880 RepID=A0A268S704_SHOCL|nr:hypothetical protein [Shouchella clausii]PAD43545.1 hypothetical protein CHH54_06400 [Bacillus sp. 7520-S]SPU19152.1 Uncharacterised protein [Niallia circulans]MCM3548919.1 hypothetical protein [Shouchella clausii]MEB5480187.1 hypothetical protein [Shouchella clausii]MED4157353.1 hypothetical protein [Shouchella clausii]